MINKIAISLTNHYQAMNLGGAIAWIIGFFLGTMGFYPWAFIGIFAGPLLLIMGTIGWLVTYKKKNIRFPNPVISFEKKFNKHNGIFALHMTMFDMLFSYIVHFWTFCIYFWIAIAFMGTFTMKNTQTYRNSINYIETNDSLLNDIGKVKYYGLFVAGTSYGDGTGELHFPIIGSKKTVNATIKINKIQGANSVVEFTYE